MSTFPLYRKGTKSGVVVKFIADKSGYIVHPGNTTYIVGDLHTDWNPYDNYCWEPYDYESNIPKAPEQLKLFETRKLSGISSSTITKVPNGYVMTSSSGHQLFIKDSLKDSL